MFETRNEPVLSPSEFLARLGRGFGLTLPIVAFSLLVGAGGYHFWEGCPRSTPC